MFDFQIGKMPEFVRVKLMQVDFGAQSPARDPYCAVSIKEAIADAGKFSLFITSVKSCPFPPPPFFLFLFVFRPSQLLFLLTTSGQLIEK
jgi:hypothetical protein